MSNVEVVSCTVSPETYTTREAAGKAGITRATLQAWIKDKKVKPPEPTLEGARAKRVWSESDLSQLRATNGKIYWRSHKRLRKKR